MIQSSNNKLFAGLIVALGLVLGWVYYNQFASTTEIPVPTLATSKDDLTNLKDLKIDFTIFDNAAYKALSIYGQIPVSPGVTGKKDIFAP